MVVWKTEKIVSLCVKISSSYREIDIKRKIKKLNQCVDWVVKLLHQDSGLAVFPVLFPFAPVYQPPE